MENSTNPFPKNTKFSNPSKLTKIIAVVFFVLVVASLVLYLRTTNSSKPVEIENQQTIEDTTGKEANEVNIDIPPASVDLNMVEDSLKQTSKNLDSVDNLENL